MIFRWRYVVGFECGVWGKSCICGERVMYVGKELCMWEKSYVCKNTYIVLEGGKEEGDIQVVLVMVLVVLV